MIKFRAWDLLNKEMYYWETIKSEFTIGDFEDSSLKFMQFTGLTDVNGNEIYEGDIFHMGDLNITYTVVWHDTGFMGKQNGASSFVGLSHWKKRIEVINNIYENPELLERE